MRINVTKGLFLAILGIALTIVLMSPQGADAQKSVVSLSAPTVTVSSVVLESCGVECTGVKVTWSTTKPNGVTITGYKVEVVPPATCPGCFSPVQPKTVAASATTATIGITTAGTLPAGSYTAKVTAIFSASTTGTKSATL